MGCMSSTNRFCLHCREHQVVQHEVIRQKASGAMQQRIIQTGSSENRGILPPKMDGENHGKPVVPPNHPFLIGFSMMDQPSIFGVPHYFWKHPNGKNGWFIMENLIKNGWFGGKTHYFWKKSIWEMVEKGGILLHPTSTSSHVLCCFVYFFMLSFMVIFTGWYIRRGWQYQRAARKEVCQCMAVLSKMSLPNISVRGFLRNHNGRKLLEENLTRQEVVSGIAEAQQGGVAVMRAKDQFVRLRASFRQVSMMPL